METIKKEIRDRLSFDTVGKVWRKVRNVASVVSASALIIAKIPLNLPENVTDWLQWIASISGMIAVGAHMDKSNLTLNKK